MLFLLVFVFFFFKQKTAYEMRISDWSSDVCSSDLCLLVPVARLLHDGLARFDEVDLPGDLVLDGPDQRAERVQVLDLGPGAERLARTVDEIGRASCRERGCQYV